MHCNFRNKYSKKLTKKSDRFQLRMRNIPFLAAARIRSSFIVLIILKIVSFFHLALSIQNLSHKNYQEIEDCSRILHLNFIICPIYSFSEMKIFAFLGSDRSTKPLVLLEAQMKFQYRIKYLLRVTRNNPLSYTARITRHVWNTGRPVMYKI